MILAAFLAVFLIMFFHFSLKNEVSGLKIENAALRGEVERKNRELELATATNSENLMLLEQSIDKRLNELNNRFNDDVSHLTSWIRNVGESINKNQA